uniref:Uncharacterized protein n=1 Tax=Trichobilharzia regenti TaxID=157069 RepID=A0AA85JA65_TRIRE|nr:unnamed protein product [Trichobilharzia regenti]
MCSNSVNMNDQLTKAHSLSNVKSVSSSIGFRNLHCVSACCRLLSTAAFASSILKIKWLARRNSDETTNREPTAQQISIRKWRWIRHTLGRPSNDMVRNVSHHSSGIPIESGEWVIIR